jgi:WD40 repeat protein
MTQNRRIMYGIIIITLFIHIACIIKCTEAPVFRSSDGHIYSLPQHKIDSSRLLVEKQVDARSSPIIKVDFDQDSLDLFFDAYDARDSLPIFFETLSSHEKSLLISLAGKNQLNAPALTAKIFDMYTRFNGITSITASIQSYLEKDTIITYLYKKVLTTKAKRKTKKNIFRAESASFRAQHIIQCNTRESFMLIPRIIIENKTCIFNSHITDQYLQGIFNNTKKIIHASVLRENKNNKIITYYLATDIHTTKNKTLTLFSVNKYNIILSTESIEHKNNISKTLFSSNGNYLITYSNASSEYPHPTLIVTALGIKDKVGYTNMSLPIKCAAITYFCFNPQSTILVTGTQFSNNATLELWDPSSGELLEAFTDFGKNIELILFNSQGTRMLTACRTIHNDSQYALWNTEQLPTIELIKDTIFFNNCIAQYPQFNNAGTILVLPTKKGSVFFINSITGKTISETHNTRYANVVSNIIFTPDDNFCLTTHTKLHKKNQDTTSLWNAKKGTLLRVLLIRQNQVRGVGLSPDMRYAIITFHNYKMSKVMLIDQHPWDCFHWIKNHASLTHMYAIYHAYKSCKRKEQPSHDIMNILETLPTQPCNMKKFIQDYLVRPKSPYKKVTQK